MRKGETMSSELTRRGFLTGVTGTVAAGTLAIPALAGATETAGEAPNPDEALDARTAYTRLNPQDEDYTSCTIEDFGATKLFSDWKLGSLELHHRMVKTAAGQMAFFANNPAEYIGYYENFAKGGVEMVWVENFAKRFDDESKEQALDPHANGFDKLMLFDYSLLETYDVQGLLDAIHAHGAYAGYQLDTMGSPIGPLTYTEPFIGDYSTDDVHSIQDAIVGVAKALHDLGFDAFELNSAANNVGQSFLSRDRNNRTDEYGPQSIENRTRFVREIIAGIKEACGDDYVVQILINGVEENDTTLGDSSMLNSIAEVKAIAQALADAGADALHVRLGVNQHIAQFGGDLYFCAKGMEGNNGFGTQFDFQRHFEGKLDGSHSGCGLLLDVAKEVKDAVSIPVGAAIYMDPAHAPDFFEQALQDGKVDFLMVNRPICVDPEYVNKLREGRRDEIAPCTRCMHCYYSPDKTGTLEEHCRVNAASHRAFHELMPEGFDPLPAETSKKVMVVGSGPAGLEAARIAAQRGHDVTLYEKQAYTGGLLPFASAVKGPHENLIQLIAYLERQLELTGVRLVTGQTVDADFVAQEAPDAVIVATGGVRAETGLEATSGTRVLSIDDYPYTDAGTEVVVYGSNCQAADLAVHLVSAGKHVTIVTPDPIEDFEKGHSTNVQGFIKTGLNAHGTRIWPSATITAVGDGFVTVASESGVDGSVVCDTVIDARDMLPDTTLTDAIAGVVAQVYAVGDCNDPYNIAEAIAAGNLAARAI